MILSWMTEPWMTLYFTKTRELALSLMRLPHRCTRSTHIWLSIITKRKKSLLLAGCHLAWFWRKSPSVSSKYGSRGRRSTVVEKATGSDGCLLFRLKGCTRAGFHSQTIVMTMIRDWIKLRFQMQRNSYWISISFGFLIITSYEL